MILQLLVWLFDSFVKSVNSKSNTGPITPKVTERNIDTFLVSTYYYQD
jgi:hypothetical protein